MMQLSVEYPEMRTHALLFLFTYCFLLRLPSEVLPLSLGEGEGHSVLTLNDDKVVLHLKRRCIRIILEILFYS